MGGKPLQWIARLVDTAPMNPMIDQGMVPMTGPARRRTLLHTGLDAAWCGPWPVRVKVAILIFLIWTAVGLFQSVPEMLRGFLWYVVAAKLIDAWAWAILTPAVLLLDRRLTAVQPNIWRLITLHLLMSVPFSIVHTYLAGLLLYPIPSIWWNPLRLAEFEVHYFLGGWVTYCAFVSILQAFKFYRRLMFSQVELATVEKRLIEWRLNALRLQLEPHFLFNTLNAISSELAANPEQAREMIEDLGALLRRSIDSQNNSGVTLAQELALLDHYLSIQKLRFGKRLDIRVDVEPAMLSTIVPSMLLQPLIENAIRHGIEGRVSGGMVAISARRAGEQLQINILDDGIGLPPNWRMEDSVGVGVRVTRERLEALYPGTGGFHFTVSPHDGGGTEVAIRIPLHRNGDKTRGAEA